MYSLESRQNADNNEGSYIETRIHLQLSYLKIMNQKIINRCLFSLFMYSSKTRQNAAHNKGSYLEIKMLFTDTLRLAVLLFSIE